MTDRDKANRIRRMKDVPMTLKLWNYEPCEFHDEPKPDCEFRLCGGDLFKHQRVGVAWLYFMGDGILADMTGLGKTNQVIGLCALLKERGELTKRALIVCQTSAVEQWAKEFRRFAPRLEVETFTGTRPQRFEKYMGDWDVGIIGSAMFLKDGETLLEIQPGVLFEDDVDVLRNPKAKTTRMYNRLAKVADRTVNINATPLQIRLPELYSTAQSVGGFEIFGSMTAFEKRYIVYEYVKKLRGTRVVTHAEVVGYKNMEEFKRKLRPIYLRRRYEDIDDVRIPDIAPPENVVLELYPPQRKMYDELQKGVLRLIESGDVKHVAALAKVTYGAEICAGLPALGEPDGPQASVKLDWFEDKITGDWVDEKVVVFSRFKGTIKAMKQRLQNRGIGMAVIWGDDSQRQSQVDKFWNDPNCRVIVGTSAIERSLNLQNSRIVTFLDIPALNPARIQQVVGRIRRVGSVHDRVYTFNLLAENTQEERYEMVLAHRAGLADYVWGEDTELFRTLSPIELLQLIRP